MSRISKSIENRKYISGLGVGEWGRRSDVSEYKIAFWNDENVPKLTLVMVVKLSEYTNTNELYILNVWIIQCMNYISTNLSYTKKKIHYRASVSILSGSETYLPLGKCDQKTQLYQSIF